MNDCQSSNVSHPLVLSLTYFLSFFISTTSSFSHSRSFISFTDSLSLFNHSISHIQYCLFPTLIISFCFLSPLPFFCYHPPPSLLLSLCICERLRKREKLRKKQRYGDTQKDRLKDQLRKKKKKDGVRQEDKEAQKDREAVSILA